MTGLISVDVALITATNARLDDSAERQARGFRDDLWAGLMPHILVPSLNDRRSDITLLFQRMLRSRLKLREVNVHKDAIIALESVDWSANYNIRGLAWAADDAASRYHDFEIVTTSQLPADLLRNKAVHPSDRLPPRPAISQEANIPSKQEEPVAFPTLLVRRYREDLEMLCDALWQTRDPIKPDGQNLLPARALRQLLGIPVTGADIERLIVKLFLSAVFKPPKTLTKCLLNHGLRELQRWAQEHPFLHSYVEKARLSRDVTGDN